MAITPYATFTDCASSYEGTLDPALTARVTVLCKRASGRLDRIVPSLQYRLASGDVDPDVPMGLVVEAVLRLVRNPTGTSSQAVGPFQQSVTGRAAVDAIEFDLAEVHELLDPVEPLPSSFTVAVPARDVLVEEMLEGSWYDDYPPYR